MTKQIYRPTTLAELNDAINQARTGDEILGTNELLGEGWTIYGTLLDSKDYISDFRVQADGVSLGVREGIYHINPDEVRFVERSHNGNVVELGMWRHESWRKPENTRVNGTPFQERRGEHEHLIGHCILLTWGIYINGGNPQEWAIFINKPTATAA